MDFKNLFAKKEIKFPEIVKEVEKKEEVVKAVEEKEEIKTPKREPSPREKILREHGMLESNIPVNHPYWKMK